MKIRYAGYSRIGSVRLQNEDSVFMEAAGGRGLFAVADGIGGRDHGEVVSGMICEGLRRWWLERLLPQGAGADLRVCVEEIKALLRSVNAQVTARYGEGAAGSTVVLLLVLGGGCAWVAAGDSRIYRARGLSCRQVTRDDTFENLAERPLGCGPENNGKLVGAVGIYRNLELTVRSEPVRRGDRFLLCSDGVHRYFTLRGLGRRLVWGGLRSPKSVVEGISEEVDRRGAADNYSAIFVKIG